VISESVAVLGRRKSAFAKEILESGFAAMAERTDPARAACPCRVVIEVVRVSSGESCRLLQEEMASLDRGLAVIGVRGRDMGGGSEARESRIPATLRRPDPSSFRKARMVARYCSG
jgi:hypothetical protein